MTTLINPTPTVPSEIRPGLAGVTAFTTEIAEPDRDGGALRYRGVNVEELVAQRIEFGRVWALLVDGKFGDSFPTAGSYELPYSTRDACADVQSGLVTVGPAWHMRPLLDVDDLEARNQLSRLSATAISLVAQSARGPFRPPVPESVIDACDTVAAQFMTRWRGEPDPRHVEAIDAYWVSAAEHGMNASTFTARVIASTGASAAAAMSGAVGAMSGPLHGGAPARVLPMIREVLRTDDPRSVVTAILDRGERLMGFGHRVYRAEDPRARVLRATARRLGAELYAPALALEDAALHELRQRRPGQPIETNVEFWAAVVLDLAGVPGQLMPALFTCARTAGWSAHILEQKRLGKLVRPAALYTGPEPRAVTSVPGWRTIKPAAPTVGPTRRTPPRGFRQ